jgi:hypothetical protein
MPERLIIRNMNRHGVSRLAEMAKPVVVCNNRLDLPVRAGAGVENPIASPVAAVADIVPSNNLRVVLIHMLLSPLRPIWLAGEDFFMRQRLNKKESLVLVYESIRKGDRLEMSRTIAWK